MVNSNTSGDQHPMFEQAEEIIQNFYGRKFELIKELNLTTKSQWWIPFPNIEILADSDDIGLLIGRNGSKVRELQRVIFQELGVPLAGKNASDKELGISVSISETKD